jgi:hypothetical protein
VLDDKNQPQPIDFEALRSEKGKWIVRRVTPPIKGERIRQSR